MVLADTQKNIAALKEQNAREIAEMRTTQIQADEDHAWQLLAGKGKGRGPPLPDVPAEFYRRITKRKDGRTRTHLARVHPW